MTKVFLILVSILFILFGGYAFINPASLLGGFGVEVSGVHGTYEVRSLYGGVHMALGVLSGLAALKPDLQRTVLIVLVTFFGGYVFGRFGAMLFDGPPEPSFYKWIAFEFVSLLIAVFLLRRHDR